MGTLTSGARDETERKRKKLAQLGRFIVRLRIIADHSLAEDRQRLVDLSEHSWVFKPPPEPGGAPTLKPIPLLPTEQVESAIARIRPLLVDGDGISYKQVLRALGEDLSTSEREELALWRGEFEEFDPEARAGKRMGPHIPGAPVSNTRIGSSWLYGDLVHADASRQSYTSQLTPESVFVEAQRMTCGLILASLHTLDFLELLQAQGRIDVGEGPFTRQVTVIAKEWAPTVRAAYQAAEGTELPESVDEPLGPEWKRFI
ncbi:hypothetical protein [Brachybacterium kimchii]|uniref:Uncharacterized protein n=1 Tax=Brachybacterium kimchii TaxID=2942909 RepID=A0ABY4NAY8_9MICO|nr:hypothetical protein [Brachybacterium kimchii]UQN30545.1 hypothetical protein M4486_04330 [Brachybacterium kimchii]